MTRVKLFQAWTLDGLEEKVNTFIEQLADPASIVDITILHSGLVALEGSYLAVLIYRR